MQEMIEKALKTPGWDGLEGLAQKAGQDQAKQREEERAEAAIVAEALATPKGRKFLAWLIGKTLLRPPGAQEQQAQTAETYPSPRPCARGRTASSS